MTHRFKLLKEILNYPILELLRIIYYNNLLNFIHNHFLNYPNLNLQDHQYIELFKNLLETI